MVDGAEAGVRGILCEKPIATSLADADRMIEACEEHEVVMSIDHTRRWWPHYNAAAAKVRDGSLGVVRRIVATAGGPRAMLFRNGTHLIDAMLMFVQSEPEWVVGALDEKEQSYGPRYAGDGGHDPDMDPGASAIVQFSDGVRAFVNFSKGTPNIQEVQVFAEDGRVRVDETSAEVCGLLTGSTVEHRLPLPFPVTQRAGIAAAITELIDVIERGGQPACPPGEARKTLEIMLAILQSQAAGHTPVRFPVADV